MQKNIFYNFHHQINLWVILNTFVKKIVAKDYFFMVKNYIVNGKTPCQQKMWTQVASRRHTDFKAWLQFMYYNPLRVMVGIYGTERPHGFIFGSTETEKGLIEFWISLGEMHQ